MLKFRNILTVLFLLLCSVLLFGAVPQWWVERGVVPSAEGEAIESTINENYSAANIGQLMFIASRAAEEINAKTGEGAGSAINNLVSQFSLYNASNPKANYELANVGQVKYVAKPFYDKLWELKQTNPDSVTFPSGMVFLSGGTDASSHKYPWNALPENPTDSDYSENYEIANIGQIKNLFSWSLDIINLPDTDGDGIPDNIENIYGGDWNAIGELHYVSLLAEGGTLRQGTNNIPLERPLKVRAIDERGNAVANVPLLITTYGGSVSSTSVTTSSSGECSIVFTPNFTESNVNKILVEIDSNTKSYFINFYVKEQNSPSDFNVLNTGGDDILDTDPYYDENKLDEEATVPRFKDLIINRNLKKEWTYKTFLIPAENPDIGDLENSGCSSEHTSEVHDNYIEYHESSIAAAYIVGRNLTCPQHGEEMYSSEEIYDFHDLSFCSGFELLKFYFDYFEESKINNESISLTKTSQKKASIPAPDPEKTIQNTVYAVYSPWIYGYSVSSYGILNGYTAYISGTESIDGVIFPIDLDEGVTIKTSDIIIITLTNDLGLKNTITGSVVTNLSGEVVGVKFYASNKTQDAVAKIKFNYTYTVPEGKSISKIEGTFSYYLKINASGTPNPFTISSDESAGPRYRKISLSGRPISDDKPQMESESDIEPAETYVDALSLALRHSVKDISISIPESGFQLSLRRDYKPLVWNFKSGLRPHEAPENAFGGNWSTNVVSYVRIDYQNLADSTPRTGPDMAVAVDENGESFSFGVVGDTFYPMPSGRSQKQSYLNSLSKSDLGDTLILRKKYGNTLFYEYASIVKNVSMNRIKGSNSSIGHYYYRLKKVIDRHGNKLIYDYPVNLNTLIPQKIYLENDLNSSITIQQENGKIVKAWDGEGNCIEYEFSNNSPASYPTNPGLIPNTINSIASCSILTKVKSNDTVLYTYDYDSLDFTIDNYAKKTDGDIFYNFESSLKSITDATNNIYTFEYEEYDAENPKGIFSYDTRIGYYISNATPRRISKVIQPDLSFAEFSTDTSIYPRGSSQEVKLPAKRRTIVKDADLNQVVYTWVDIQSEAATNTFGRVQVEQLQDFGSFYDIAYENDFSNPITIYFPQMRIEHFSGSGEDAIKLGEEDFEFEIDAGMALKKVTDFSGNVTEYEYEDSLADDDVRRGIGYASKFSDPTKERRYVNGVPQFKEFTYSQHYRIMDSLKEYGAGENLLRKTVWEVDEFGRRTSEKLYASEDANPVKETQFAYDDTFKNFLAETLIKDGAGAGKDMLTRNIPDENGRVSQSITDPEGLALATSFEYNQNGRKILETDPNGNSTAFEYDSFNRLVKVINPDATERTIEYDNAGRKIKTVNENGVETSYTYNANGLQNSQRIKMSENPSDDILTQTSYSSCGKILSTTDANGNITAFEYDGMGRLLKMTKYEGDATSEKKYITSYTYTGNCGSGVFSTDNFKPSTVTDPRGNSSTFTHDSLYRETSIKLPFGSTGSTTAYEYDAFGNKIKETDALGNITTFEYDAQNKLIKTTFADGTVKSATYSAAGLVLSETDELGNIISHEYDLVGRRIKTVYPSALDGVSNTIKMPAEEFFYDNNGNLIGRKDPTGYLWNTVYDSRNRKIAEVAPAVKLSDNTYARPMSKIIYDDLGNPVSAIDANGNQTDTEFDSANRAVKITFPAVQVGQGSTLQRPVETKSYDKNGNVISSVNPRGIITNTEYNSFNKPVKITKNAGDAESNQIIEELSYDDNGNLEVITDGNGNKTKYVYDAMNRRTSAIYGYESETTRTDTWTYDALNMTNRKGVALTYDSRNRILTENSRTYAYDPAGRILSVSDSENIKSNVSYAYDSLGRTISETNGGKTHNYTYDLSSHRVKSEYGLSPTQLTPTHSLSYKYDTNGRLVSITDQQNRTTSYSYDLNGNVLKKTHANGYELTYTYDALNRLKTQSGTLLDNRYYYDLGGNISYFFNSQNSGSAVNRWEGPLSYDAFDRLSSEMLYDGVTVKTTTYAYDKNSNRTSRILECTGGANPNWYRETTTYTVNTLNQVVSATKTHQDLEPFTNTPIGVNTTTTSQISYNERGNLMSIYDGEYFTTFLYDAYDMLVDTFKSKGEGATYEQIRTQSTYDYRGRRIKREVSSIGLTSKTKTKEYSYADGVSVLETSTSGTTLTYRGSDQGGGVGGVNYTEYSNGNELNYKIYNLRGDVIKTVGANQATKSFSHYYV